MIYQFIRDYNSKRWTIEVMCRVLKVSRSGYYRWLKAPEGKRKRKYMELGEKISNAYFAAKGRNGIPRLARDLQKAGTKVSRISVARHMKQMGLRSVKACVSDITYISCLDGFLYLTCVFAQNG